MHARSHGLVCALGITLYPSLACLSLDRLQLKSRKIGQVLADRIGVEEQNNIISAKGRVSFPRPFSFFCELGFAEDGIRKRLPQWPPPFPSNAS